MDDDSLTNLVPLCQVELEATPRSSEDKVLAGAFKIAHSTDSGHTFEDTRKFYYSGTCRGLW